jgi:hypothetical protein
LKDFLEKQAHVAGYTDNVAIKSPLPKKFPSNKGIPFSLPLSRGLPKVAFDRARSASKEGT